MPAETPTSRTVAVTHNVESRLTGVRAAACLVRVLEEDPDLVGLQEWRPWRRPILRQVGGERYTWVAPVVSDCVAGLRTERYAVTRRRATRLGGPAYADPGVRRPPVLPPRWATVVEAHDRVLGAPVGVVVHHLVPGAQRGADYRTDRPRTVAQHRREVDHLRRIVTDLTRRCDTVWALGDTNFHGLDLPGLTSAWAGQPPGEGTLGSWRRIDDVHGPGRPTEVRTFVTASDHRGVVVVRADLPLRR